MQFDQRLDQGQAQARPAPLAAHKPVENMRLDVEGDAPTRVRDLDLNLAIGPTRAERDRALGRGLAQGVFDQVVQDLAQAPGVGPDQADIGIADQLDSHPDLDGLAHPARLGLGQQVVHPHIAQVQGHFTGVDLGDVQHIVDGAGQLAGG